MSGVVDGGTQMIKEMVGVRGRADVARWRNFKWTRVAYASATAMNGLFLPLGLNAEYTMKALHQVTEFIPTTLL